MLPGPIAPPAPVASPERRASRARLLLLAGAALLVLAVAGGVVWTGALSPIGYDRFPFTAPSGDIISLDRTLELDRAGTYVVFEEFAGASEPDLPPPVEVSVFATDGRPVTVRQLIEPGERTAPRGYDLLGYEGRGIAEFVAPRPGRYLVQLRPLTGDSVEGDDHRLDLPPTIAVGRDVTTLWLAGWGGLVVMSVVPFVLGAGLIVTWRRKSRAHRDRTGRD